MGISLVPRTARALSAQLNAYYRVLKGVDPDSVALRLPSGGSFEVRHSATAAPVFTVTDAGATLTVGNEDLADNSIDASTKLADGSVTTVKLAPSAVTNPKIAVKTIRGGVDGPNGRIADLSIVDGDISATANINGAKLADSSIPSTKIIGGATIPANSIDSSHILNGSIQNADLALPLLIAQTTLAAPAAVVAFSAIPQTYLHLWLVCNAREDAAGTGLDGMSLRFNGSASGYGYQVVLAQNATLSTFGAVAATSTYIGGAAQNGTTANNFALNDLLILNYAHGGMYKHCRGVASGYEGAGAGTQMKTFTAGGVWQNTAPITQVQLLPGAGNFMAGSHFALYGLAA